MDTARDGCDAVGRRVPTRWDDLAFRGFEIPFVTAIARTVAALGHDRGIEHHFESADMPSHLVTGAS